MRASLLSLSSLLMDSFFFIFFLLLLLVVPGRGKRWRPTCDDEKIDHAVDIILRPN